MSVTVRPATPADADTIIEFNRRLAHETEGKTLDPATLAAGVRAVLADPLKGRYYVAEEGGTIVGQLGITLEWSDWRNGAFWWIQSVYVVAAARRTGVFRRLYEYVVEAARQDPEAVGVRLYVEHANETAQQTYVSLGMRPAGYSVLEKYPL